MGRQGTSRSDIEHTTTDEESFERAPENDEMGNEFVGILPMGYEEHLTMYSLDFEEFLWARNVLQESIDEVKDCIHRHRHLSDFFLKEMDYHFRDHMIVDGILEAAQAFVDRDGDYMALGKALGDTISNCLMDFEKYSHSIKEERVRDCFFSIQMMLSQFNKKFMFARI